MMGEFTEPSEWYEAEQLLRTHILSLNPHPRFRAFLVRFKNRWQHDIGRSAEEANKMFDHLMNQEHLLAYLEQEVGP